MKSELQGKLVEILGNIQSSVGKASDFAIDQLPSIANEYIAYGRTYETILFAIFTLGILVFVCLGRKGYVKLTKEHWDEAGQAMLIFSFFGTGFFSIGLLATVKNFILVWTAPKVWLIHEIARLVK